MCGMFINEKFNERSFQVEKFSVFSMIRLADRIVAKNGYELSFLMIMALKKLENEKTDIFY